MSATRAAYICQGTRYGAFTYIQSWLQVLRNDCKFIVSASSKAEKAVNYILGKES